MKDDTTGREHRKLTATYTKARYTGDHPHIRNKTGVYYYSADQGSYLFRPDGDGKSDWYRVWGSNLETC